LNTRRKATSKIIPTVAFICTGIIFAALIGLWGIGTPGGLASYKLKLEVAYLADSTVANAKWQIDLQVKNEGNAETTLYKVYINKKIVQEYGLVPGDALTSSSSTGTSLPQEGVLLKPGDRVTIHLWIGRDVFSSGTQISVEIRDPTIPEYKKYVTLS